MKPPDIDVERSIAKLSSLLELSVQLKLAEPLPPLVAVSDVGAAGRAWHAAFPINV
jgi:hypothetical protein